MPKNIDPLKEFFSGPKTAEDIMNGFVQRPRVFCLDGFNLSIQANFGAYCRPRTNKGPYEAVELGYPSCHDSVIIGFAEEPSNPTGTVYPYVPVEIVALSILAHGGRTQNPKNPTGQELPETHGPVEVQAARIGKPAVTALLSKWIQAAVLGTCQEEESSRFFFVNSKGDEILSWNDVGALCLSSSDRSVSGLASAIAEGLSLSRGVDMPKTKKKNLGSI